MEQNYSSRLPGRLARPLAALGLLLATAGAAQAQTPTTTFVLQPNSPSTGVGSGPSSVAIADVNGDGKPDALTANFSSNTLGVLLGNGAGGFTLQATLSTGTGSGPYSVAIADVNGDGKLDALTANRNSSTLGVLLGNGAGGFTLRATPSTGANSYPLSVAIADVNGDGKLDALTANEVSSTLSVLLGNGAGGFTLQANAPSTGTNSRPSGVAIADVNGDGKPDALTANYNSNTLGVLLGNGAGGFTLQATLSTGAGSGPSRVAIADVNGDGKPDALTANLDSSPLGLLLGNGAGGFTLQATPSTGITSFSSGLAVADVDGDGNLDAVTSSDFSNTLSVLLGNGAGGFTLQANTPSTGAGSSPSNVAIADVNGDGKPDALTANFSSNTLGVLLNTTVQAPTLTTISPNQATVGTSVTLTGSNLTGATAVTFAGTSNNTVTTGLTVSGTGSSQTLTVVVPTGATTGPVTVTTPAGTSGGVTFTVLTSAPVLANIEPGALPYAGGQAPAQVTGTLSVSDADSPNLTGATVTIGSGFMLGDRLNFANQNGITGSYTFNSSTGTLTLVGTAPVAAYQAALRSVTFSTLASSSAVAGDRVVSFSVSDGTNASNQVVRTIRVVGQPAVTTAAPSGLTSTSAVLGGNVTANGGDAVTDRGVVYSSTTTTPTIGGTGVTQDANGLGAGGFSKTIAGLAPTTAYYVRAYATNSAGTSYGSVLSFTTLVPTTAAPVLTSPAANSNVSGQPAFAGMAPAGSTVTIYLAMGGGAAQAIGTTTATGGNFSFVPSTALASGTYAVYATAQSSGSTVSTNSNTNTFTVDATPPTVTLATSASNPTTNPIIPFSATFSEPVTGYSPSSIAVTNGTIVGVGNVGNIYYFTVQATTTGPVTVSIAAGAAQDAAGNDNLAAGPFSVTYALPMSVAPALLNPTNGSTTGSPLIIGGSAPTGSFVSITVTNLSNGASASRSTSATNNNFSSQFTLPSGTYQAVATAQQSGSQPASSAPITFTVDATAPTATISSAAGSTTSTALIPFTVSFSEAVQGFSASSVSVTNGTISSAITTVGNDYSFSVTPTASGAITVTLPANAVRDQVGNFNTTASSLSVTYTAPITATAWTGAVSTDWFDAGNWTQGVPTATVDATISPVSSGRYPLVAANTAAARNLSINSGASLTMSGGTLDVRATLTNNSTFVATGGTIVLGTSTQGAIVGSSPTNFWSLQVERSGALLATSAGAAVRQVLTLNGNFDTNGNVFTLRSTAAATALVVNNGGVVSGTTTVQRTIDGSVNPGLGYRHYSSPVANSTVGDLVTPGFTPIVNPAYNTAAIPASVSPYPTVFGYDDSRLSLTNNLSSFDKGYFSPSALSDPLAPGRGYTLNISASEVVDFQGTLASGTITLPLTSTRPTYPDGGWQLLGNPYPAPLDYSRVAPADRQGLEGAIYVYASTSQYSGRYRTYVNGIGNPVLPVAQGFFARVASGQPSATMTFRNAQRLTTSDPTTFQRSAASPDPRPLVQLELRTATSAAVADEFFAYAEAGATPAFDAAFDAEKLPNPTGFNLAGIAPSGPSLAVDARAAFTAATVLPLSVGVPAPGPYALSAATLANLPAGLDAYLADDLTGQLTRLAAGTSYSFSVSAAQAAAPIVGRFRLLFRPATALATTASLRAADVAVFPNPARTRFTVVLPGLGQASTVQAELRNALGQLVRRQTVALPASGTQLSFDTAELATGVYTLRLQAETTNLAKRVVIE
jgi:hypothetical protein